MIWLVILVVPLIIANIIPYLYTGVGLNFLYVLVFTSLLICNVTLVVVLLILYFFIPKSTIHFCFKRIGKFVESICPELFKNIEENIKQTFKIDVLYPLPEKSIRIWHPHGITAAATGIHNAFRLTNFKYNNSKVVVHDWFHYFPLGGDILSYFNCMRSGFNDIKKESEHNSITVALGGVDEMGRIKHKQLELVIKSRKGIFRIALETGMPIVPVLTYGENELFPEADSEILIWFNSKLYEYFSLRTFFPSIKSLRNWLKLTTQPLDPIYTYTGRPIYVKKIENPTAKHIETLRKVYIQRVRELFKETNNGEYSLKII